MRRQHLRRETSAPQKEEHEGNARTMLACHPSAALAALRKRAPHAALPQVERPAGKGE